MDSRYEVSSASRQPNDRVDDAASISWRATLLGAAVGIAGQAYGGTLLFTGFLWLAIAQGTDAAQAYKDMIGIKLSPYYLASLAVAICSALGAGWTAASFAPRRPLREALLASLCVCSFFIIAAASPHTSSAMLPQLAVGIVVAVAGGLIGALWQVRRKQHKPTGE